MTKYHSSDVAALLEENNDDFEDTETAISGLPKNLHPFPGEQYFNGIMLEKMRPKKVAKFRASRKLASDL